MKITGDGGIYTRRYLFRCKKRKTKLQYAVTRLFFAIFFGTFVLEDGALVGALALVARGEIAEGAALLACFSGIAVGDLLVYGLGYGASRIPIRNRTGRVARFILLIENFKYKSSLSWMIVASRALPGTRLPTYLLAGFMRYPFLKFALLTAASVLVWVLFAFGIGRSVQLLVSGHWLISSLVFILFFLAFRSVAPRLTDRWRRKALVHSWRRWCSFEFWPAWFFYLPIFPYYAYLALRYRSLFLPFYANPGVPHAGFVGESKWDFYRDLCGDPAALKTRLLRFGTEVPLAEQVGSLLAEKVFSFPFILKPDTGQRGFGVRIIRNDEQLSGYLREAGFDILIQEFCPGPFEAGVFYYRLPGEQRGRIFSITDKRFPFVTGDGVRRLGDLILSDPRARIIAETYFERFGDELELVPASGEKVVISTCGNHCQGAVFLDGSALYREGLLRSFDRISRRVPGFYFGRYDIRYQTAELLRRGEGFKIVELNGAGSEATHIWDPRTRLIQAYTVLFRQWEILFRIGFTVKKNGEIKYPFSPGRFIKDLLYLTRRNKNLSTSS